MYNKKALQLHTREGPDVCDVRYLATPSSARGRARQTHDARAAEGRTDRAKDEQDK